jgi:hypothetical protein
VHWLAGRRFDGFWIMPDEAIYARRALDLWQHGHLTLLHGEGVGYGVLYPILVGLPLATGDFARGYHSLKLLQALVVSLSAVAVIAWARRLMPPQWAAVAAVLTLASPLLLYSGLVMTEVLFYPVAVLTLFAIANAVERGTVRSQALAFSVIAAAVLTRVQGIVFVAVFAAAVVLDAAFARDTRRLRRFWPLWTALGLTAAVAFLTPGVFGPYAGVLEGSYPWHDAVRLTLWHAAWTLVSTAVVPGAVLVLTASRAVRTLEPDPPARALVAVALGATVLVPVQVGLFSSRYAPHLLERNLASLPPLLFLVFALWLARGAPRPRLTTFAVAFATLAAVAATPWQRLVDVEALPDTFSLSILYRLRDHDPAVIATATAAVALALFALVPRRVRLVLPTFVAAVLIACTVVASDDIAGRIRYDQVNLVGKPHDWIDRAADDHAVTYLYDGETYFNGVWQATVWNDRIDRVVTVAPARLPGPMPQEQLRPRADGSLGFPERYVAASTPHTFRGTALAHVDQPGTNVTGLTLWRLEPPARLSTVARGVLPNGDMFEPAHISVFDCAGGRLEVTLLPKETRVVTIFLGDRPAVRQAIAGLPYWNGGVSVPAAPTPRVCRFTIQGEGLLGSTRIAFVRR